MTVKAKTKTDEFFTLIFESSDDAFRAYTGEQTMTEDLYFQIISIFIDNECPLLLKDFLNRHPCTTKA